MKRKRIFYAASERLVRLMVPSFWVEGVWLVAFFGWVAGSAIGYSKDVNPPNLVFNNIAISLEASGWHTLTATEIASIAADSSDESGITNTTVVPSTFCFCDVGQRSITLSLTDSYGNVSSQTGPIRVLGPGKPHAVYVDGSYPRECGRVAAFNGGPSAEHWIGFDASSTVQAAVDQVTEGGVVYVAAGEYIENVIISKPLFLIGPNAGIHGETVDRRREAKLIPQRSDPENSPILSVESDNVVIDGLMFDGGNPALTGGYIANGVPVHAAAGIQNGTYPDMADVEGITIRNNIITNISYDGICLDRYPYFGTASAWNYIRRNKLANMWEGILTYALDSVITHNVISNVTHGLSVHCVTTAAPKQFFPLIASNSLTIAQWWPIEIQPARAPGIWVNFRSERASPIEVAGNVINTPAEAPVLRTIIGLFALTIEDGSKVRFADNTVNGSANCNVGMLASSCWSNGSIMISGGALLGIRAAGILADTLDAKWGPGNCIVNISNVNIEMGQHGVGVLALQELVTPENSCLLTVSGHTQVSGGTCGVAVRGSNAAAAVVGSGQHFCGNEFGIYVDGGRALIEGNILTNNAVAGILVENDGIVDAGDCSGINLTGLPNGSGLNGASVGSNDLSGYGCDQLEPWAICNSGTIPVLADRNLFRPKPGEPVANAISGPVQFSDLETLTISAPPSLQFQCIRQVPAAAVTIEEFLAAGGSISSGTAHSISSSDLIVTNRPGNYLLTRTYTLSGGCAQPVSCEQLITARDDQVPSLQCSPNIIQGVDPGCDYATVTFTNVAVDSCGELLGTWVPVSTGQFPTGITHVIVIATDLANNSTACGFDVTVIPPPKITLQPASRTNNAGTTASFKVAATSAAPLTFHWKKNTTALADAGSVSGAFSSELSIADVTTSDEGDYSVEVSNLAGSVQSTKARLTVLTSIGTLRILSVSSGIVQLEARGSPGRSLGIVTSTNLLNWVGLHTNRVPFVLSHTNETVPGCRFYRAVPGP